MDITKIIQSLFKECVSLEDSNNIGENIILFLEQNNIAISSFTKSTSNGSNHSNGAGDTTENKITTEFELSFKDGDYSTLILKQFKLDKNNSKIKAKTDKEDSEEFELVNKSEIKITKNGNQTKFILDNFYFYNENKKNRTYYSI